MDKVSFKGFHLKESLPRPKRLMDIASDKTNFYRKEAEINNVKHAYTFPEFNPNTNQLSIYLADENEGKLLRELTNKQKNLENLGLYELASIVRKSIEDIKQYLISTIIK